MKEERAEIYETFRSLFRLMINTLTFLTTANITIIGFAFNNKSSMLVLFGSLFPIIMLFCFSRYSLLSCTVFSSGMRYRDQNEEQSSLFFSTTLFLAKPKLHQKLKAIIAIDNAENQFAELQQIKYKFMPPFTYTLFFAFALFQVLASFYLWHSFDWSFA